MLLLHISDIHFQEPDCLDEETDPDHSIRTRVSNHLRTKVEELGQIDGILVGGDIAYKGRPEEYKAAKKWLDELADICGCSPSNRIFVVPGNHDVDRGITSKDTGLQNVQHRIVNASAADRDQTMRKLLRHEQSGRDLFAAHTAYNEFAAPLACQIYPKKIFWHQDIPLGGGVMLRINGLTSTLLSGKDGKDDQEKDLYLGMMQTALDPVEDRVHLVLCHHPIDWLMDREEVEDDLNGRAKFQLFGHKHKQRIVATPNYLRILAGAVNPSRKEPGWEPGYNLLRIDVHGAGADRHLEVETHQFRLQRQPEMFVPVQTEDGKDVFRCTMRFPGRAPLSSTPVLVATEAGDTVMAERVGELAPAAVDDVEASMGDERRRDLIHRFWNLDDDMKRAIMLKLELITEEELTIPEPELYGTAFLRAGERHLIDRLADMVSGGER
jgi:predicted MPP superfamily phosphohydrolase